MCVFVSITVSTSAPFHTLVLELFDADFPNVLGNKQRVETGPIEVPLSCLMDGRYAHTHTHTHTHTLTHTSTHTNTHRHPFSVTHSERDDYNTAPVVLRPFSYST